MLGFFLQNAMTQAGKDRCGASRHLEYDRRCLATGAVLDWAVGVCRHSVKGDNVTEGSATETGGLPGESQTGT